MAEVVEKKEVEMSPVGTPKKSGAKNKDGFVAGQLVSEKDYFKYIAEQNNKSKK